MLIDFKKRGVRFRPDEFIYGSFKQRRAALEVIFKDYGEKNDEA